jgi:lysozyme family protein
MTTFIEAKPIYCLLYKNLFFSNLVCGRVDAIITKMIENKPKYDIVARAVNTKWYIVAILHCMESALNFSTHLHNGDPLITRTKNIPKGRIPNLSPPYKWEQSAIDALQMRKIDFTTIRTIEDMLWFFECWNGLAYWHINTTPPKRSPYLWASSNQYIKGKYTSDGKFDPEAVSKQIGVAIFLRRFQQKNIL